MSENTAEYLEKFPSFLQSLGEDAAALGNLVETEAMPAVGRQILAGGLNYLFRSLDLIPDGIDDIGLLDDAFVLRVASEQAMTQGVTGLAPEQLRTLNRLAEDMEVIGAFLGEHLPKMEAYVSKLKTSSARGRAALDIVQDKAVRDEFLGDVRAFSQRYRPPRFAREDKTLVKLHAFFEAKLPKQG